MKLPRRSVTVSTVNGTTVYTSPRDVSGPQASTYSPSYDKGKKMFKGGVRQGSNDYTCKNRNTRIYITALGGLNVTVPTSLVNTTSRILQSVPPPPPPSPVYSGSVTIQSEYWSSNCLFNKISALGFAIIAGIFAVAI